MVFDICFYRYSENHLSQCPELDYAKDIIIESLELTLPLHGKRQLSLIKRGDGNGIRMFIIYNYVFNDRNDTFGICIVFYDKYPHDINCMFRLCGLVIADVIKEGKVLHFDSNGVILGDNNSLECHYSTLKKHKEKIKSLLQKQSFNVKPIPLNVFNNYIDQHTIFQLSDKSWSLEEALNYNNIVVVTEEIEDENIYNTRNLIIKLNETIEKLNQQITILQSQHKKQENDDKKKSQEKDQIKNTIEMKKNVKEGIEKKKMVAWIMVVLLFLATLSTLTFFLREKNELINTKKQFEDVQEQVSVMEYKVDLANLLFENISAVIKNVTNDTVFSDWTSINHSHGSTSFQDYNFEAYEGDKLSFGYFVSSEKNFDRLIVTLRLIDKDTVVENVLITASGEEVSHVSYYFERGGAYSANVKYVKDSSVHKFKDMAGIINFVVSRNHKVEFDSINSMIRNWCCQEELSSNVR